MEEVKPKRKYTKKPKNDEVTESVKTSPIKKVKFVPQTEIKLSKTPNNSPEEIDEVTKKLKEIFIPPVSNVVVYVYHEGSDIDTVKYIKEFQDILGDKGIGSQVVFSSKNGVEKVGIRNCFCTEDTPSNWTDFCLSKEKVLAIRIKERPRNTAESLFKLIKEVTSYEDDFVQFYEH